MKKLPVLPGRPRPLLFAHRGCSSLAPENTMASFSLARDIGSPGIELDVHVCASGELVVAHDDSFLRTANDSRNIEAITLDEIRAIDVGSFFDPKFSGERVSLLEEVLEEFCPGMYIDIELKTKKTSHDLLPGLVALKLKSMGEQVWKSVTISSFNPLALRNFKKEFPEVPTAHIWSRSREVPWILRRGLGKSVAACDYLKPEYAQVHSSAKKVKSRTVIPWTIDDPGLAEKMVNLGVAGIITNRPQDMPAAWRTGK